MKTKRILSAIIALIIAATCVVSVSAAQLTDEKPDGKTEVTARIEGSNPGDVSYIITIPDVVDFGLLTQPASDDPDYKDVEYTVEATMITGLDEDTQQVSVYVKDQHATINGNEDDYGQDFWITNKTDAGINFNYDVYDTNPISQDDINIDFSTMSRAAGYYLTGFTVQGESLTGTLRLDQAQLYGYDLADIVGEYSGYMVFFSMIEDV